ncbi:hypothetical protein FRB94_006092 [Tulasnella sp. JGI-2019a]|nr:hypothetical protein FRB93_013245 [Tulasnella sp. JGI-2019a]KAG8999580.1 hypothetical protein FRB94_006092 [Tulasnella sp. JGI-2019a]
MRFSVMALALAASIASASTIADLLECALECLTTANMGGCSMTDQACLCNSQDFITSSTTCVRSKCSAADDQTAAKVTAELCQAAGVTLPPPASASAASTSAVAPITATASSVPSKTPKATGTKVITSSMASMTSIVVSSASPIVVSTSASATSISTKNAAPTAASGSNGAVLAALIGAAALAF